MIMSTAITATSTVRKEFSLSDNISLCTPTHGNHTFSPLTIPSTPNKKTKTRNAYTDNISMTPSKSHICKRKMKPFPKKIRKNHENIIGNQNIQIPILSPIPTDPHNIQQLSIESFEGLLGEKLNRDFAAGIRSPVSDLEVISPLSDTSLCSPVLDLVKKPIDFNSIPYLPWSPRDTLVLNPRDGFISSMGNSSNIIPSTLLELQSIGSDRREDEFVLDLPPLNSKGGKGDSNVVLSVPQHKNKIPVKPIIRNDSKSLNLIVSSGSGSLDDATIYATEINASSSLTSDHEDKSTMSSSSRGKGSNHRIPIIQNVWERVTIPVNYKIKEKHKKLRSSYYGEIYDSEDEITSTKNDYALIRGYEFNINSDTEPSVRQNKTVRWNIPLSN